MGHPFPLQTLREHHLPGFCGGLKLRYLSLGQPGSSFFFRILCERATRSRRDALLLRGIKRRGPIPVATAIADRLVHRSEVLTLGGHLTEEN